MSHSRRTFLKTSLAAGCVAGFANAAYSTNAFASAASTKLTAATALSGIAGSEGPATAVWAYNQTVPGPVLRRTVGDRFDLTLQNDLFEPTTLHWHGLRVPVAMDGVPYFSQPPVDAGATFQYQFDLNHSGTYWYHPHINGARQVDQGLHGVLIVDEETPPDVDRDVVWALDDWRMDRDAQLEPFGGMHDLSHGGRIGNVVTVNGLLATDEPVRTGERIRLRLINVANARLFAPHFPMPRVWVVALDGHPVAPFVPDEGRVWLAPGQRADLIIDMTGDAGEEIRVLDTAYGTRQTYHLMSFNHGPQHALRDTSARPAPSGLRTHDLPEPELEAAERQELVLEGGAMGGLKGAHMDGKFLSMRALVDAGRFWALNGTVPGEMTAMAPLFRFSLGSSQIIQIVNRTAFPHPMHLHGHTFRVISKNGKSVPHRPWRDTVIVWPNDTVEIAFVADNPGTWMCHCHILEHQEAGMMATVEVA